ncbi:branched-chain-amino-acid transaminase [Tremella mesenterica]|uniref:Branched-chain-amino-acid aminotransferase n=1 Tax=Tremella mesenterica TaxID=5217 RepID=A0A4Q1BIC0_TREME|nr:branched-chain-amino-acid transaminase [Tremella mesenterica]
MSPNGFNGIISSNGNGHVAPLHLQAPPAPTPSVNSLKASNLFFSPAPPGTDRSGTRGRYMLSIPWSKQSGWGQPKIGPLETINLDPLAGALQYAVSCFEGMKCYKGEDGQLRLFRPDKNFDRLKRSAWRIGLPYDWDNSELLDLLVKLVALEAPIVPNEDGTNLYIRPTLIDASSSFGLREDGLASEAMLYVATGINVGTKIYPSADGKGLKLNTSSDFIRAWPGGTGSYKLGANYGESKRPVHIAKQPGYAMSLWLHGDRDYISEAGGMNIFVIKQASDGFLEFVTMSLANGIVLPGVTRSSIIELLTNHASGIKDFPTVGMPKNIRVVERDIPMQEIIDGIADGFFGCGTGVVVVSIAEITYANNVYHIPYNPLVRLIRDTMTALQRGKIESEWSYKVPAWSGPGLESTEEVIIT